jgi:filamentous hemagglutinin
MTIGRNLLSAVTINTSGAMFGSTLKGEDPKPAMAGAAVGTVAGYAVGKGVEIPLNNKLNYWSRPDWIKGYLEMSTWNAPSKVPSVVGNLTSSFGQEYVGDRTKNAIGNADK